MEQKVQMTTSPEYIIVHHSATQKDRTTFEAIRKFHIEQRGFWEIGYHYFIDGKGKIHSGRPENYVGAHCSADRMNFRSIGICLAGNFEEEEPSNEQLASLTSLLELIAKKYNIPHANILGHLEVIGALTACPGKKLLSWLKSYRDSKLKLSSKKYILNEISKIEESLKKVKDYLEKS